MYAYVYLSFTFLPNVLCFIYLCHACYTATYITGSSHSKTEEASTECCIAQFPQFSSPSGRLPAGDPHRRLQSACSFLQPHCAELCQTADTSVRRLRLQNRSDTAVAVCWVATCCRRVLQAVTAVLWTGRELLKDGFGGLVVSMLASGTQVCGFKPGRNRWIFRT